jgi:hypothetical protein
MEPKIGPDEEPPAPVAPEATPPAEEVAPVLTEPPPVEEPPAQPPPPAIDWEQATDPNDEELPKPLRGVPLKTLKKSYREALRFVNDRGREANEARQQNEILKTVLDHMKRQLDERGAPAPQAPQQPPKAASILAEAGLDPNDLPDNPEEFLETFANTLIQKTRQSLLPEVESVKQQLSAREAREAKAAEDARVNNARNAWTAAGNYLATEFNVEASDWERLTPYLLHRVVAHAEGPESPQAYVDAFNEVRDLSSHMLGVGTAPVTPAAAPPPPVGGQSKPTAPGRAKPQLRASLRAQIESAAAQYGLPVDQIEQSYLADMAAEGNKR